MFFCFSPKRTEKKSPRSRRVHPLFVRVSKMAKKSYQKMQPMSAKEKQLRAAEAAGVAQFLMNASIPKHTGGRGPRTVKIKDAQDTAIMAATLLQKMWRGVVAKRGVAAVRVAVEKRPSFEPCQSASVAARTARGPTASKPARAARCECEGGSGGPGELSYALWGHGGRARRPPDGPDGLGARDAKSPARVRG